MPPDPPREDSGDDENLRRFTGELIEGVMDDEEFFLVPDAPYELDMEEESEYSDSDEDLAASSTNNGSSVRMPASANSGEGDQARDSEEDIIIQGNGRGRYRLLIPFTVDSISSANVSSDEVTATTVTESSTSETHSGSQSLSDGQTQINHSDTVLTEDQGQHKDEPMSDEETPSTSDSVQTQKREIEMTEEKVETIMRVMRNITLPSTSIPPWAAEVDEDAWRKRLNDSIGSKSQSRRKSSADKAVEEHQEKDLQPTQSSSK